MSKQKRRSWKIDDAVVVEFDSTPYEGHIVEVLKRKATVLFDDGDTHDIPFSKLQANISKDSTSVIDDAKDRTTSPNIGFNQYNITWNKEKYQFEFRADKGVFYGYWRKTRCGANSDGSLVYAIDIYVKYLDKTYNVECIHYHDGDPRIDMYSLDSDICAACNKWFYTKCHGDFESVEALHQKANRPMLTFHRLESLDRLILKLKEFRSTAIRCGGQRIIILDGEEGHELNPLEGMRIKVNFTQQAMLSKRIPSLHTGVLLDSVLKNDKNMSK